MILIIMLLIASIYSASETAFLTLQKNKKSFMSKGSSGILEKNPLMVLNTILLGNSLAVTVFSNFSEMMMSSFFETKHIPHYLVTLLAIGFSTIIIVIFAESIPKNIGLMYPKIIYRLVKNFIKFSFWLFCIVVYPITIFFHLLLEKALKKIPNNKLSEKEIRSIINLSYEKEIVDPREKRLIDIIISFYNKPLYLFMIPRKKIISVEINATIEEAWKLIQKNKMNSLIVTDGSIDHIVGYLSITDLAFKKSEYAKATLLNQRHLLRPIVSIPESKRIIQAIHLLKMQDSEIALVIDEYGGTEGLFTINYLLKNLFDLGGSFQNWGFENSLGQKNLINSLTVDPLKTGVRNLREFFHIETECEEDDDNLARLILQILQRFPQSGETVAWNSLLFTIETVENNVIQKVRVEKE